MSIFFYVFCMMEMGKMVGSVLTEETNLEARSGLLFIFWSTVVVWLAFPISWFCQQLGIMSIYNCELGTLVANFVSKVGCPLNQSAASCCRSLCCRQSKCAQPVAPDSLLGSSSARPCSSLLNSSVLQLACCAALHLSLRLYAMVKFCKNTWQSALGCRSLRPLQRAVMSGHASAACTFAAAVLH